MDDEAKADLQNILLPYATVATPNIPEAEEIVGFKINSEADIYKAGKLFIEEIGSKGVVIKGGHSTDLTTAKDYLFTTEDVYTFDSPRYETKHTHGTGCTFSKSYYGGISQRQINLCCCAKAKNFIALSIKHTPEIGQGRGPVNHFAYMKEVGLDDE